MRRVPAGRSLSLGGALSKGLVGPLLLVLLVAALVLAGVLAPNADAQARWRVRLTR